MGGRGELVARRAASRNVPSHRQSRRWLVAAALSAFVLGCGTERPVSMSPTAPAAMEPMGWYALRDETTDVGVATQWILKVGMLGQEPFELGGHVEAPPEWTRIGVSPMVVGATTEGVTLVVPHRGGSLVQHVGFDGQVADATELRAWVDAAALAHQSGQVFVALLDERGRDAGIGEVQDGGVALIAPGDPRWAVVDPDGSPTGRHRRVMATPDGRTVFVTECTGGQGDCSIRAINTADGRVIGRLDTWISFVYGASTDQLFFDDNCERPCPMATYDAALGTKGGVGTIVDRAMLMPLTQPAMIVWDKASGDEGRDYEVRVTDLVNGDIRVLRTSATEGRMVVPDSSEGYAARRPVVLIGPRTGFFASTGSETFVVVDAETGQAEARTTPLVPRPEEAGS